AVLETGKTVFESGLDRDELRELHLLTAKPFLREWQVGDAPRTVVAEGVTGSRVVACCLVLCALLVLALKIHMIVQLVALLARIRLAAVTAPATSGGSLLTVPAAKRVTGLLLDLARHRTGRVLAA
ncbi:hypothetical protein ACWEPC_44660, partial [Nonomuraea sp. NPDC004297]